VLATTAKILSFDSDINGSGPLLFSSGLGQLGQIITGTSANAKPQRTKPMVGLCAF
jgi:hypothetical protein